MGWAAKYRDRGEFLRKLAADAPTETARDAYLRMAQDWEALPPKKAKWHPAEIMQA
jgi:hypothetical protein